MRNYFYLLGFLLSSGLALGASALPPPPKRVPYEDFHKTYNERLIALAEKIGSPISPKAVIYPPSPKDSSTLYTIPEKSLSITLPEAEAGVSEKIELLKTIINVSNSNDSLLLEKTPEGHCFFSIRDGEKHREYPEVPLDGAWVYVVSLSGQVFVSPYSEGGHRNILESIYGKSPIRLALFAGVLYEGPRSSREAPTSIVKINNLSGTFRCSGSLPSIACFEGLTLDSETSHF